jgi:hypothetical protein
LVLAHRKLACSGWQGRTAYFELTLLKSVNSRLVANKHLPAGGKLTFALQKP